MPACRLQPFRSISAPVCDRPRIHFVQAALEAEAEKPLGSQQRITLNHDLTLMAEILEAGRGPTESVLLQGYPCTVIPLLAQRRNPALIVLGTQGGGSIDRFILGSTAEGILRHSSGPALTVGPNVNILRAGALNIRRILYATDCTTEAVHAAPVAVASLTHSPLNWMC